ncbi:dihydrodipicolinate synthase family protein [Paenibacillus radicis (ex Xue et al. 2023)]|uniref:Dihydrodipicolinate synthase family protein n=1 Tax=Paenibacillus radicis (ex Xue et al. 2023) TaxID=2972489 RepID=A0ABT1YI91_9BACL|nr:dihydrodipicolinate synthase family protein [Paenibacillus radicis (ex Xue et al. 2023)]MCR8632144.1 dihydrodipicolinate synthase family protein [Paenibacillus radicis (ex Xue et al. 2023)]
MSNVHKLKHNHPFSGVYSLLLTPFLQDGSIDWNCYDKYVDWQLSMQPNGLFAVCGSSEMGMLTLDERLSLAEIAVKRAGKMPVVATANVSPDTGSHAEELLRMENAGVSGVVFIPPKGMGENQERLGAYFADLADRSSVPVVLYECPSNKPHLIDPHVYSSLVVNHGVVGIKDTTCTIEGIEAKIKGAPDSIVYQANTQHMLDAIHLGAGGIMAITATAAADVVIQLWREASCQSDEAVKTHEKLVALDSALGLGYTATAKYLAALRGIPMSNVTRTNKSLSEEAAAAIRAWHSSTMNL